MKKMLIAMLTSVTLLPGCTIVSDALGHDSATLNARAATDYATSVGNGEYGKVERNTATARRIHTVFNRMKPYADQANETSEKFEWELTVFRNDTLNAWAMPGGKMAFYTGIVEKLKLTDDEIAAIMGHEMAHALREHGKKKIGGKWLSNKTMQITGEILTKKGIDGGIVNIGTQLMEEYGLNKPYSRNLESEADAIGIRLMAQAGYNPEAAPNVWRKMNEEDGYSSNGLIAALTSTHPTHNARIAALEKLVSEVMPLYEASDKVSKLPSRKRRR